MARQHSATRQEGRDDGVNYTEMCYNSICLHSSLGYVIPIILRKLSGDVTRTYA